MDDNEHLDEPDATAPDADSPNEGEVDSVGSSASEGDRANSLNPSRRSFIAGMAVGAVAAGVPAAVLASRRSDPAAPVAAADAASALDTPETTPTRPAAEPTSDAAVADATASTADAAVVDDNSRRAQALEVRERAARMAADMDWPDHVTNGDERADIGYAFSFTKGLPHDYETGLLARPEDFERFVSAIELGSPQDFIDTPLGPDDGFRTAAADARVRGWESQSVGLGFDLIGPDMQTLTMPPPPSVGSVELTGEMAEVYAQAVIRDEPLANLRFDGSTTVAQETALASLGEIAWFDSAVPLNGLSAGERQRRRPIQSPQTAFRGRAPGENLGPYVSQLLLAGTPSTDGSTSPADGLVRYGAQTLDQRVRQAAPVDFMTDWDEWFDVQNALFPQPSQRFESQSRFITSGRDLATFVHADALYQAYFNACLVLFGNGVPLDPGTPFADDDGIDHQQGFVLFAPNHVLAMLGEVSMRALKTVKYQKFNVHRRLRPEELAGRVERADVLQIAELDELAGGIVGTALGDQVLASTQASSGQASMLLPMAYAEGSPMHPSYGAGHGTVAGACATLMKALLDHNHPIEFSGSAGNAFVANRDGTGLELVRVLDENGRQASLTVEGEVNKLAANIALGRGWAGVHYYSDYWESMLLGEAITLQILREHMLTSPIDFTLTVPTFEGSSVTLSTE